MPISYNVSENGSLVYVSASGTFNVQESIDYQKTIAEDKNIKLGYKTVFDTSNIEEIDISEEEIGEIADITLANPKNSKNMKVAIIANTMIIFKICKYYEKFMAESENVNIFNNLTTAKSWLGVS